MNPRNLILITLAAAGVILVVLLTRSFLANAQNDAKSVKTERSAKSSTSVLVAKRDMHVGTILRPEDTQWLPWPEGGVSDAYYVSRKDKLKSIEGKVVRSPLHKGEPLTRSSLVAQGERGFLAAILSPGMRAVTVKLSPTSGIGGFVFPGDRVDVILTHVLEVSRAEKYQIAETVFQNVRVLAVDQKSASDDKARIAKTATLEVTPKMAEKVAMLSDIGGLTLSLRSLAKTNGDDASSDPFSPPVSETTTHTVGNEISKFLPKMNAEKSTNSIRVARGNSVSLVTPDNDKPELVREEGGSDL